MQNSPLIIFSFLPLLLFYEQRLNKALGRHQLPRFVKLKLEKWSVLGLSANWVQEIFLVLTDLWHYSRNGLRGWSMCRYCRPCSKTGLWYTKRIRYSLNTCETRRHRRYSAGRNMSCAWLHWRNARWIRHSCKQGGSNFLRTKTNCKQRRVTRQIWPVDL